MTEEEKQAKAKEIISKLVKPHKKKSAAVVKSDIPRVLADAYALYDLCGIQVGYIPGCFAVHHSQIDSENPLNFFVTAGREIVINPVMIRHTKVPVERVEGCLSFPYNRPIKVKRFNKITVEFSTITKEKEISQIETRNLSGREAEIFQHEIDHSNGVLLYENYEEKE